MGYAYHCYPKGNRLGRAIRTQRYRLVEWRAIGEQGGQDYELYDYQTDPLERKNLAMERPQVVERLAAILGDSAGPEAGHRHFPKVNQMKNGIKALTFDVGGSIFDWQPPPELHCASSPRKRASTSTTSPSPFDWRRRMFETLAKVRAGDLPWQNADQLHRTVLDELADKYSGLELTEVEKDQLNDAWHQMDVWPDVPGALTRLREDYIFSILTVLSLSIAVDSSKHAGIDWDRLSILRIPRRIQARTGGLPEGRFIARRSTRRSHDGRSTPRGPRSRGPCRIEKPRSYSRNCESQEAVATPPPSISSPRTTRISPISFAADPCSPASWKNAPATVPDSLPKVDSAWDFGNPAASEARFRELKERGGAAADDAYAAEALTLFEEDRLFRESLGKTFEASIALWSKAKTLRFLGRAEEALAIQLALVDHLDRADEAKSHFAIALERLGTDPWLQANEAERLTRIRALSKK